VNFRASGLIVPGAGHSVEMEEPERIAQLKKRAKQAGIPAIYVNDNFGRWQSDFNKQVDHCLRDDVLGRPLAELLRPEEDDYFVLKPKHSGFFSTTLELLLQHLGATTLILTGFAGIAVTDRYGNYFHATWKNISGHQACTAHILRDLQDCAEAYPGKIWPAQAREALRTLIHARNQASDAGLDAIPAGIREPLERQFRRAITVALADVPRIPGPKNSTKQHPGRDMLEFCRDREADVLRFTTDTDVWPTNNISESGLRPSKTQQKISGRLTSDDTTQDRLDIRSYIDTARKHGCDVLDVLHALFTGNPWMPPVPGQA